MLPYSWRPMTPDDLDAVCAIAAFVHPDFPEDREVLAERLALYGAGAMMLQIAGASGGYVLSHPWRSGTAPALNQRLGALPEKADTFYLHDLALVPVARGTGAAAQGVKALLRHARVAGFRAASLIAVNGSAEFWERQGFAERRAPALAEKLASYEQGARYMVRPL